MLYFLFSLMIAGFGEVLVDEQYMDVSTQRCWRTNLHFPVSKNEVQLHSYIDSVNYNNKLTLTSMPGVCQPAVKMELMRDTTVSVFTIALIHT